MYLLKFIGGIAVVLSSGAIGAYMSDKIRRRISKLNYMIGFIKFISDNIQLFRMPLDEIYSRFNDSSTSECGFKDRLDCGVYRAALESGLIAGVEEDDIIKQFSDKIGGGSVDDMVKLCAYSSSRLQALADKLNSEYPDKRRIYRAVSLLSGVAAVIILL